MIPAKRLAEIREFAHGLSWPIPLEDVLELMTAYEALRAAALAKQKADTNPEPGDYFEETRALDAAFSMFKPEPTK